MTGKMKNLNTENIYIYIYLCYRYNFTLYITFSLLKKAQPHMKDKPTITPSYLCLKSEFFPYVQYAQYFIILIIILN